jgi:proline-rich protein PRCC
MTEGMAQDRRKHQITFLAQQAKAHEQDLQNGWADSRFKRQQAKNRYGF